MRFAPKNVFNWSDLHVAKVEDGDSGGKKGNTGSDGKTYKGRDTVLGEPFRQIAILCNIFTTIDETYVARCFFIYLPI